jgi:hypothetical protein
MGSEPGNAQLDKDRAALALEHPAASKRDLISWWICYLPLLVLPLIVMAIGYFLDNLTGLFIGLVFAALFWSNEIRRSVSIRAKGPKA